MNYSDTNISIRERVQNYFRSLQLSICSALELEDGKGIFIEDEWRREGGGGGFTRVIENGNVIEKGGVNFSSVEGELPTTLAKRMNIESTDFFATGVSLVIHPYSPRIPTVHANFRYFEQSNGDSWFGGGADLTPFIPDEFSAIHFHNTLKSSCDPFGFDLYPKYKKWCDEYFYIKHRKESRGIGGIFFDYIRDASNNQESNFAFVRSCGDSFIESYLPIVKARKFEEFTEREKKFQSLRRGRYVEFNLVYDRGTTFGLETGGRTESILMSLPPVVNFDYNADLHTNANEVKLMKWFETPIDWVSYQI